MADNSPVALPNDPTIARFFLSPQEKMDKERGRQIVKAFCDTEMTNDSSLSFFKRRNAKWMELLFWAKGSQKMTEFLDYMNVSDANKSYVNIDITQSRIAAQFVGTLVESMAKNRTYPSVSAIDDGSIAEKEKRYLDALFRMHEAGRVNAAQQASGLHLEPPNAYVPDDEVSAKVYFETEDRLPKEIRFEQILKKVQKDIKFDRIMNRRTLYDFVVLNWGCTKIDKFGPRDYRPRKCIGPNTVWNFFMNNSGEYEVTQIGEFTNVKVRDLRSMFLKTPENPGGITEKEIFELAKASTKKNIGTFNYMWNDNYAYTTFDMNRPYDDCTVFLFDCEIDCGEDVYYVEKEDPFGKINISQGKSTPRNPIPYQQLKKDGSMVEQPKPEGTTIVKKNKNTWMRGVYAPFGQKMLYWGRPDIIITPYTNVAKPLSSFTINIPNNDGEYVPSLFERILEPLREYQITKLKRKQLIAKIKPSGIRIDVESARNLDLGTGDSIAWEEVVRIYDQTGNELWSSKGVDPLQRETPPLSNTVRDESIEKVIGLTNVLASIVLEIRQLIGVPQYRDGSDVGDRTAGKLADSQNESSYNVTDFIVNANNQLWEDTFYKICLLHWNDIVKSEAETTDDLLNTRFDVSVKTKMSEYEEQRLEQDIQRYSQMPDAMGNPSLTLKDAMMLRQIDDYKLACWYLVSTVEKNKRDAMNERAKNVQDTAQAQQQSNQQTAQNDLAIKEQEHKWKLEEIEAQQRGMERNNMVSGVLAIAAKTGGEMPDWLKPATTQLFQNVTLGVVLENAMTKLALHDAVMDSEAKQQQDANSQSTQQQNQQSPPQQVDNQPQ
jgi:hypothetical protein